MTIQQTARDVELEEHFAEPVRRRTRWSATDLMATTFPAVVYLVSGILVPGLTLLVGAPKLGKSWMALNVAAAVASGGRALGNVTVDAADVLYLALEDPPRRLQERLTIVLEGSPVPAGLSFATEWPLLHDGGADLLDQELADNPDIKLVIVDVMTKIRGTTDHREDRYQADYRAMTYLKNVADHHNVAVLAVHHTRKASADDWVDTVSGTNGITGAADTIAVLSRSRGSADATLHVTGRDVPETKYALNLTGGRWTILDGPAQDYDASEQRRKIVTYLRENEGAGPKAIADATGIAHGVVKHLVRRMVDSGQLDTDGDGRYFPSFTVHRSPLPLNGERSEQETNGQQSERSEQET